MSDFITEIVYKLLTYFTYVQHYIFNMFKKYNKHIIPVFEITQVYNKDNNEDITEKYIANTNHDISNICIKWKLDGVPYTNLYQETTLKHFPPYNFHEMRSYYNSKEKIIAGILQSNDNTENVTKYLKQLAGPKQNFYSDINDYSVNTEDIWGLCDKSLILITTENKYTFDLNKKNVLEL